MLSMMAGAPTISGSNRDRLRAARSFRAPGIVRRAVQVSGVSDNSSMLQLQVGFNSQIRSNLVQTKHTIHLETPCEVGSRRDARETASIVPRFVVRFRPLPAVTNSAGNLGHPKRPGDFATKTVNACQKSKDNGADWHQKRGPGLKVGTGQMSINPTVAAPKRGTLARSDGRGAENGLW